MSDITYSSPCKGFLQTEVDRLKAEVERLEGALAIAKIQAPLGYKPTVAEVIELNKQPIREVWHPDFMDCVLEENKQLKAELANARKSVELWYKAKTLAQGCGGQVEDFVRHVEGTMVALKAGKEK